MSRKKSGPEFVSPGTTLDIGVTYYDHKEQILYLAVEQDLLITVLDRERLFEKRFSEFSYKIERLPDYPPAGVLSLIWGITMNYLDSLVHIYLKPELFRDTEKRVHNASPQRDADAEAAIFEELRKYRCHMEMTDE